MTPFGSMAPGIEVIDIVAGIMILCFALYALRELVHAVWQGNE